ncbi:MAG: hypothetical protein JNK29_00200 [Anaerolineales bacterium]|nr:hypothetical protein [Anaerolineales bacterium]
MLTPANSLSVAEALSRLAQAAGLAVGAAYVVGYLVVNMYLAGFGVANLNLVQARFLATGLLYLALTALVFSGSLAGWQVLRRPAAGPLPRPAQILLVLVADLALTAVVIWAAGQILTGASRDAPWAHALAERRVNFWAGLAASQIALAVPAGLGLALASRRTGLALGWLGSSLAAVCAAISLFVFAVFVYPAVSPAFGGGAPVRVHLLLKQPAAAEALGWPDGGLTGPLTLIDQSEARLMVLDEQGRLIEFQALDLAAVVRP